MTMNEILYRLSKEMDQEYEEIVERQNVRIILEGVPHHNDPTFQQMHGRLQILAQWACRLRVEADKYAEIKTDDVSNYTD